MSNTTSISSELNKIVNKKNVINDRFVQRTIVDSIIKNDEKSFSYLMTEYSEKVKIFSKIFYQELDLPKDDDDFYDSDNNLTITSLKNYLLTVSTSIAEVAFGHSNPYFALYLVDMYNLESDINLLSKLGSFFDKHENFTSLLSLFKENEDIQQKFFNIGALKSLELLEQNGSCDWFFDIDHLKKLDFIAQCLKADYVKESFSNYYLNSNVTIKNLKKVVNMNKGIRTPLFLDLQSKVKEILGLLTDEAKLKAIIQLSDLSYVSEKDVKGALSEKEEIVLLKSIGVSIINKDFLAELTTIDDLVEKMKGNSLLKVVLVLQNASLKRATQKEVNDLMNLNHASNKTLKLN